VARLRRATHAGGGTSVAAALTQFGVAGVIAALLLGLAAVEVLRRTGTREAIDDAKRVTRIVGTGIVEPQLADSLARGDRRAVARVDRVVRSQVLRDPVVRVKIWAPDGTIVYSDEPRLVGKRFPLGDDELTSLRGQGVEAEVSDLSRPENRYERSQKKLLEVYLPIHTPNGKPLLFESYQRFSSVAASGRRTWLTFVPALLAALLVLQLVQLPLASRMARRIRAGQRDREQLLQRAIDASETERRRIAGELHDGVVQNLAGVSYSLAAAAERGGASSNGTHETLQRAAAQTRESIRELRGLLVEIYPPSLHRAGLAAALGDAAAPLARRGIAVNTDVPADLELPQETEALVFRVAQEALRNVSNHAEAWHVDVRVERSGDRVTLVVEDDGRGFDPETTRPEGHFGLSLIEDLARDSGARLALESKPGEGTRVRLDAEIAGE
jgi:two-component system, NarL family, sensor kinase